MSSPSTSLPPLGPHHRVAVFLVAALLAGGYVAAFSAVAGCVAAPLLSPPRSLATTSSNALARASHTPPLSRLLSINPNSSSARC
jgi:hypothetical protein